MIVNQVYAITREGQLAKDFGVCSQLQRASVSIMSNIAEGFERIHVPEKIQFCRAVCGRRPLNRKAINPNSGSGHCFTSLRTTILVLFPGPRSYDLS